MAKRRRVKPESKSHRRNANGNQGVDRDVERGVDRGVGEETLSSARLDPVGIAAGLFSGAIVYVAYYPSDSVAVESGDALWFALLALVIATVCVAFGLSRSHWHRSTTVEKILLVAPWSLAAWMMLAAWGTSTTGNLRMATNEGWLWVTAAAMFTSARILCRSLAIRRAVTAVVIVCACGLAVHGLHQYFVSLPANREAYERDPERILALAAVEAPPGSSERMVFENRLFDGGPTGTFALANSLAASLLVGVIAGVALIRWRYRYLTPLQWIGTTALVVVCLSSLMAARSRSATLAMLIGILMVLVGASIRGRNRRAVWMGVAVTGIAATVIVLFLAAMGNREWFEQAPASVAFRFQYWRSSWNLVLDHPWFGAGPGNFQSLYERYREASAHEQIAEPHNLFVETLASGGFVGFGLLSLLMVAGGVRVAKSNGDQDDEPVALDDDQQRWVWLGAILSVALVWLFGFASRRPPDLEASLWVLPLSILAGVLVCHVIQTLPARAIDHLWGVIVVSVGIHLLAAGGWTVPGVAIALWFGGGLLTRVAEGSASKMEIAPEQETAPEQEIAPEQETARSGPIRGVVVCAGVVMVGCLYAGSIRPVEQRQRLMTSVLRIEQPQRRRQILERATEADPWSPEAVLWLADSYRWSIVLEGDNPSLRRQWSDWLEVAKERAGDDPAVYRMIGAQQLHVYQRHGNPADLQSAADTFSKAVRWSPANQWMMAQMALISAAAGDSVTADTMSGRAWELSEMGGNIERALSRQQVYLVRRLGVPAENGPIRVPAADVLAPPP